MDIRQQKRFSDWLFTNKELAAAMVCGLLILAAWLISSYSHETFSVLLYIAAFLIGGYAKAAEGLRKTVDERKLNVEMLMIFAAIGSGLIGYWVEGAILIFIFSLSGALETYTMNRSHREISSLMNLQPEEAVLIDSNGMEMTVPAADLSIGDQVLIRAGERIPSDGVIIKGSTSIDEAAITGESLPVTKNVDEDIFAGTVNVNGTIIIRVTKKQEETLFSRIIQLVQNAKSERSPSQLFIEKFEGTYVNVVLIVVLMMMFLPHFLFGWSWNETIYRAMVLLVVASPCALVASIMPASLSAISNGARRGILFKGGVHLQNLGNLKAIAFDKTGTLTKGRPEVTHVYLREGMSEERFLQIAASIEKFSTHPLADSIVNYALDRYPMSTIEHDAIENVPGHGVIAMISGVQWKVGKAAFVGTEEAYKFQNGVAHKLAADGNTIVFVRDDRGIAGLITLKDTIRPETAGAIDRIRNMGIHTVMLTGDGKGTARAIASESKVDDYLAECLPDTKVREIKKLRNEFEVVAMVGDGINDAPALATASIGIAMGQGTDVALETADVVLMKNNLSLIAEAVEISNKMNRIIKQNIAFSVIVILVLIFSNFMQSISLPLGVIGHEGSTILVILNGLRLLRS